MSNTTIWMQKPIVSKLVLVTRTAFRSMSHVCLHDVCENRKRLPQQIDGDRSTKKTYSIYWSHVHCTDCQRSRSSQSLVVSYCIQTHAPLWPISPRLRRKFTYVIRSETNENNNSENSILNITMALMPFCSINTLLHFSIDSGFSWRNEGKTIRSFAIFCLFSLSCFNLRKDARHFFMIAKKRFT